MTITASFTANGVTASMFLSGEAGRLNPNGQSATYTISNVFTATVTVERSRAGRNLWVPVAVLTGTGSGTVYSRSHMNHEVRVRVSDFSAGQVDVTIADNDDVQHTMPKADGGTWATIKDSGVEFAGEQLLDGDPGTAGDVLTSRGAGLQPEWASAAGGMVVPIGGIVESPSAPTGNGTWLECDGSAVAQATYAALYALLGHSHMNWTAAEGTPFLSSTATQSAYSWIGTKWLLIGQSTTDTYVSSNGLTWLAGGALNNAPATRRVWHNGAGTVIIPGSTTAAEHSADYGVTWATITLPVTTSTAHMAWNGTHWLLVVTNTTNCYSSTDGITWTTQTGVLTVAPGTQPTITWDGTHWLIFGGTIATPTAQKSSVSDGSSGWTTITPPGSANKALVAAAFAVIPGAGWSIGGSVTDGATVIGTYGRIGEARTFVATGQLSAFAYGSAYYPGLSGGVVLHSGFNYIIPLISQYILTSASGAYFDEALVSTDGLVWNHVINKMPANNGMLSLYAGNTNSHSWISDNNVNTSAAAARKCRVFDKVTGKVCVLIATETGGSQNFTPHVYSPTCTPASQFCLPSATGHGQKRWIRAL